jgi:hypothetical protein
VTDVAFVIAGYAVILGGLALYAGSVMLRLRRLREEARALHTSPGSDTDDAPPVSPAG